MAYKQHHAWIFVPAWGHITSGHATLARTLELNPDLVVTVVHHAMMLKRAEADIAQYTSIPRDRVNLIGVGDADVAKVHGMKFMMVAFQQLTSGWLSTLSSLVSSSSAWPAPTALMNDQFGLNFVLPDAKKIVGDKCKTFMHWTPSSTAFYSFLAPSSQGGFADYEDTVQKYLSNEDLKKGRERPEILEAVSTAKNGTDALNGTIVSVPGLGTMYDYEREASNGPTPPGLAPMLCSMVDLAKNTDGIIVASSYAIEGEAIETLKKFRTIYPVGVSVAPRGWERGIEVKDIVVKEFLDKFGKDEVLYIAFGSHFFPTLNPEHILSLLTTLTSLQQPFILALGSPLASATASSTIPASLVKSIEDSGKGLIHHEWVDQQAILAHESVGWFLTHGGWNGICEGVIQGVPMFVWPLAQGDQAVNGALVSLRSNPIGFEFIQIRQGAAKQKATRTGKPIEGTLESVEAEFKDIFMRARGAEGAKIRENVRALAKELREERDGRADKSCRELSFI